MTQARIVFFLAVIIGGIASTASKTTPPPQHLVAPTGFAVVELFTSEGCSSCPPADRILGQLKEKAAAQSWEVFPLSFHVDYWDRLGWKDPFSKPEFSQRQRQYAQALGSRVYTPMMLFNGHIEAVGSRRDLVYASLRESIQNQAAVSVSASINATADEVLVKFETASAEGKHLHLALVERHRTVSVRRGENKGRTLNHYNIVRDFKSFTLSKIRRGTIPFDLPEGFSTEGFAAIVFIQDPKTNLILAATEAIF